MMSVLLIAVGLWYTGATQVGTLHAGLTQVAGFAIAAAGSVAHRASPRGVR